MTLEDLTDDPTVMVCDSSSVDANMNVDIPCTIADVGEKSRNKIRLELSNNEPLTWTIKNQAASVCEPSPNCAIRAKNGFLILHDVLVFGNTYDAILKENDSGQWEYQTHYSTP